MKTNFKIQGANRLWVIYNFVVIKIELTKLSWYSCYSLLGHLLTSGALTFLRIYTLALSRQFAVIEVLPQPCRKLHRVEYKSSKKRIARNSRFIPTVKNCFAVLVIPYLITRKRIEYLIISTDLDIYRKPKKNEHLN